MERLLVEPADRRRDLFELPVALGELLARQRAAAAFADDIARRGPA
jgi:hypothetical protein